METKMEILLTEALQVTKTEMEQEQAEIQLVLEMEMIKSLEVPTANQRLKRKETIIATIRFTRGGSVSIQSVTGGNSQSQAAARRAASNVHVSFLTDNCSSGIVTLQFNIN